MHEYAIEDKKISVVYNGYNLPKKVPMKQHNKNLSPYFLYVGTIQPRKNLETLIEAFSTLHSTHPEFKLIMAGKKGWLYDAIFKQVEKLNLKEYIHFLGYVTDEEKNNLYAEATALVLPSLYEGFGIPLLEAMALGCPVISSFSSSLPEVGGEACLYFDPKNGTDLVEKMSLLITDKDLRINLIATGKQRAQLFSWRQSGEQTLTILMKIPL